MPKLADVLPAAERNWVLSKLKLKSGQEIGYKYLSNIERGISIPSTEVIMRLAIALETTPDEFLAGTAHREDGEEWQSVAEELRTLNQKQLKLTQNFIRWVSEQDLS